MKMTQMLFLGSELTLPSVAYRLVMEINKKTSKQAKKQWRHADCSISKTLFILPLMETDTINFNFARLHLLLCSRRATDILCSTPVHNFKRQRSRGLSGHILLCRDPFLFVLFSLSPGQRKKEPQQSSSPPLLLSLV
jgi:hypothetical protein